MLALLLPLALAGCSTVQFFYDRLDSLALMEAERWLDLDREQAERLRQRIDERLDRHRSEELPRYADVLELTARHIEHGASAEELDATFATVQELLREAMQHSVPVLAQTFDELEPAQVEHFAGELRASNDDYREEYLEPSPERRRADRLEAATDGIERWTGRLAPAQRALLASMIDTIPDGAPAWFERRLQWQQGVLALLREGAGAGAYTDYLEQWWVDDARRDPAHAARMAHDRTVAAAAIAALIEDLPPAQRARASDRLQAMAAELRTLHAAAQPGARLVARAAP